MIQKIVEVYLEGIKMEITIFGNPEWTEQEWQYEALQTIKSRLLERWNAWCE